MTKTITKEDLLKRADIALIISIGTCIAWILPIIGIPGSLVAIVLGLRAPIYTRANIAVAIAILTLILGILNAAVGALAGSQGFKL